MMVVGWGWMGMRMERLVGRSLFSFSLYICFIFIFILFLFFSDELLHYTLSCMQLSFMTNLYLSMICMDFRDMINI